MAMRKGFKQTEIGVIPQDWLVRPISELSERIMVGIASAATHAYRNRGVVMFRNQNIKPCRLDDTDVLFIDPEYEETYRNKRLKAGDLVTARTGYPGTTSIVPGKYENSQSFTTLITRPRRSVNSIYLCYFINSEAGKVFFEQNQAGGGQKNVNAGMLKNMPIPLPPTYAEQEAIAGALSDADAWIESLEQLTAKKRQIKQGAMQELLTGRRRLPGFSGEWTRIRLGDEIDLLTGFPFPSQGYAKSGIRLLRGSNIKRGETDWSEDITQYWSDVSIALKEYVLREGDIVVAMDGSLVGRSFAQLSSLDLPALLLQRVARIRSTTIDMGYLKEHVCSDSFTVYCDSVKTVTAIPHISPKDIRDFTLPLPQCKEEQSAISTALREISEDVAELEFKLAKARQIKQAMMQELLTGRIRLIEPATSTVEMQEAAHA